MAVTTHASQDQSGVINRLRSIARREPLRRLRRYGLLSAALLLIAGSSTWGNWQRFTHGPRPVNEKQLIGLMQEPDTADRFLRSPGLRYLTLDKPLFVDAGFTWQSTTGAAKTTISEFKFIVLADQVLLARTKPGQADLTSGVLRPMTYELRASAKDAALRFGKKTQLSSLMFDTTSDPRAGMATRIALMLFTLTFLACLFLRGLIAWFRPHRRPLFRQFGSSHAERTERAQLVGALILKAPSGRSEFVSDHLVHHDRDSFSAVKVDDIAWAFSIPQARRPFAFGQPAQRNVVQTYSVSGNTAEFPVGDGSQAERILDQIQTQNPAVFRGNHLFLQRIWNTDPSNLADHFRNRRSTLAAYAPGPTTGSPVPLSEHISIPSPSYSPPFVPPPPDDGQMIPVPPPETTVMAPTPLAVYPPNPVVGQPTSAVVLGNTSFGEIPNSVPWIPSPKKGMRTWFSGEYGQRRGMLLLSIVTATGSLVPGLSTATATATPAPVTWDPKVLEIVRFIEANRGELFKNPVPVMLLSPVEYDRIAGNERPDYSPSCTNHPTCFEKGKKIDIRRETFELLGMRTSKPADRNNGPNSIGFYSPRDKRLFVRGATLNPASQYVLAHELTHAWQDQTQTFPSDRSTQEEEESVAWTSLVESNAMVVAEAYVRTLSEKDREIAYGVDGGSGSPKKLSSYERMGVISQLLPYSAGPTFYKEEHDRLGKDPFKKLYQDPPKTIGAVLGYGSTPILPITLNNNKHTDDFVLYEEPLSLLSYYALLADQQKVDIDEIGRHWKGGSIQLVGHGKKRCARLSLRNREEYLASSLPRFVTFEDRPPAPVDSRANANTESTTAEPSTSNASSSTVDPSVSTSDDVCSKVADNDQKRDIDPEATQHLLNQWSIGGIYAYTDVTTAKQDRCLGKEIESYAASAYEPVHLTSTQKVTVAKKCDVSEALLFGF